MLPFFTYKLTQNLHGAVSFSYHTIHSTDSYVQFSTHIKLFYLHQYYCTLFSLHHRTSDLSACTSNVELKTKQRNLQGRLRLSVFPSSIPITPPSPRHDGGGSSVSVHQRSISALRGSFLFCFGATARVSRLL